METIGSERVLYGSDHPYQPLDFELEKIAEHLRKYMGLENEVLKKVLGENIERLLAVKV